MSKSYTRLYALTLFLTFAISTGWWHHVNARPSSMDETRHMQLAIDYRNSIEQNAPLLNDWSHVYPPLYHLCIIPALSIGVPSEAKVAMTYLFDLLVLLTGCLLLGRSARRPAWESILAAFLCLGYDYALWASRRALIDFPLMAWTTLSVGLLSLTDGFSSLGFSLFWGASAGLGLLLKAPFVFFIFGPFLWIFLTSRAPAKTKNAFASLALAGAISLPWYFWESAYFLSKGLSLAAEQTATGTDPHSLSGWLFYLRLLPAQVGLPSLLFSAVGLVLAFRRTRVGAGLLVAWFASGYFILTLLINKDPRHTLPLLPVLAILAARGWGSLADKPWKVFILTLMGPLLLFISLATYDRPAREDWKHASIISLITKFHDPSLPFLSTSVLSHHPRFFARTLKWSAFQEGIDLKTVSPGDSNAGFAEFIVRRQGDQGTEAAVLDKQWQDLIPNTRAFLSLYSVGGRLPLPDGSEAVVYHRDPHPHFHVSPLTTAEISRRIAQAMRQKIRGPLKVTVQGNPAAMLEGRLDQARLTCDACEIDGLRIQELEIVVEKPWFNLYRLWDEGRLGLLSFDSLKPSLILTEADVQARLSEVKGLSAVSVQLDREKVLVRARYRNVPLEAQAHITLNASGYPGLNAILDRVTIGSIALPGWLIGKAHRQTLWLYPLPDFPGKIILHRVTIQKGRLGIS